MKVFDSQRLHFRPLDEGDEALYCHLYTDPVLMRHIAAPLSVEAAQRCFHKACALATQQDPSMQLWVITERGSSAGLGLLARVRHADATNVAELGTMLVAEGQGRGYAAEALGALIRRLFALAEIRMLWTAHAAGNAAAVGLMRRLGFVRDLTTEGGGVDWHWQLDRDRWRALRAAAPAL